MLLSSDGTKAFVCVPKTGTNSVRGILNEFCDVREVYQMREVAHGGFPWDEFIRTYHKTVEQNLFYIREQFPNASVGSITAYGFLRDPVDRWCSAVNFHYKRTPMFLSSLKSVASNPKKMHMLGSVVYRLHEDQCKNPAYNGSPELIVNPGGLREVQWFYSPDVLEEMAQTPWEEFPIDLKVNDFFYPQSYWLKQPNTVILDYSKFEEEMAWLVNEVFRGYRYYQPKSNSSYRNKSEVKKLPVSDSLCRQIMDAYSMDYDLTPHTLS